MGELVSYWSGFETRWDATAAPEYITMQDFEAQLGTFDFETGPILQSYWQMDWPQLTELAKQFGEEMTTVGDWINIVMNHIEDFIFKAINNEADFVYT